MSAVITSPSSHSASGHKVVSRDEWIAARRQHLIHEKELTRQRDRVNTERRELPWVKVDKAYVFDTPTGKRELGKRELGELFEGRRQLIVYHFMWRHDLGDGCIGCSFLADHIDGANLHLPHNDVTLVVCSRAPFTTLETYRRRMGWRFTWISSEGSDFNYDYHVSFTKEQVASGKGYHNYEMSDVPLEELSGLSVFYKEADGQVYHTYSSYNRGNEEVLGAYMYLDITPQGRNENGPNRNLVDWVRHHDKYGTGGHVDPMGGYHADGGKETCCAPTTRP